MSKRDSSRTEWRGRRRHSPVVVDGDLVYTAGQVAFDEHGELVPGGIEEQTRRALENLTACLSAAGAELSDVLKVNAYLADLGDFAASTPSTASSSRSPIRRARRSASRSPADPGRDRGRRPSPA